MRESLIREGDNEDITAERRKATFCVRRMAAFIHGGEEKLKRRAEIRSFVESLAAFNDPVPTEFMDRETRVENNARKAVAMTDNAEVIDRSDFFEEGMFYQSMVMGRDMHAMSLHYVMFVPTLQGQTDDEQLEHWLPLAVSRAIIGTYAQTEMGHGTNLRKLETTATYDPEREEFVLHTPTITAAKWWPGGLGKCANYAIVIAQLITNGVPRGPHPFIVQLRDLDTHLPLKGVAVGDIGPKLGINGGDHGFVLFDHYRIPRRSMLMRYAKVLPSGEYVAPKHAKLEYGTMVFVRSVMIRDQAMQIAAAAVIAIRYSAVRRQGEIASGSLEVQIIDYRSQQYRVFPQLAKALVFLFAATEVKDLYLTVTESLASGKVTLLEELHVLSSGLKAVVSWEVAQGIEQCRLACGGHGYSCASGIPEIYAYAVGGCTYEGENIVMLLQVARFLMKGVECVRMGQNVPTLTSYLSSKSADRSSFTDWKTASDDSLVADFEHIARKQIFRAYDFVEEMRKRGHSKETACNAASVELCKASRLHVKCYLVKTYLHKVSECGDEELRRPLILLARLFILDQMAAHMGHLLKGGYMGESQADSISRGVYEILEELRPNAVALADSFDLCDRELHSVLGRRDGNVYSALLQWATQSQLNRSQVLPLYDKFIGPMVREARSKL